MSPQALYEGSSMTVGTTYQNIPSRPDIPFHRGKSDWRAKRICELVDVKGRDILDLGCSVGTMSSVFKDKGANSVFGIDHDREAIGLALKCYGDKVSFVQADISLDYLERIHQKDIVVWTSQFMWMVKQHGMENALDFMFELSKKCNVLVFETAGIGDGCAPLDITQEEVLPMLIKNTCFQDIRDYGPWGDEWTTRNVFVCKSPKLKWVSLLSTVERIDRDTIVKTYDNTSPRALEICKREAELLKDLLGERNFPYMTDISDNQITMRYSGLPAIHIPDADFYKILTTLKFLKITHRDIQPANILWDGEHCILVDFAYAVRPGEITNYHYDLGGKYKCPHGFNDEYSLKKVQQELLCA